MPRHVTHNGLPVACTVCHWRGHRLYRGYDDLSGKPQGLGLCPKCHTPTLARVITHRHCVRKAS